MGCRALGSKVGRCLVSRVLEFSVEGETACSRGPGVVSLVHMRWVAFKAAAATTRASVVDTRS